MFSTIVRGGEARKLVQMMRAPQKGVSVVEVVVWKSVMHSSKTRNRAVWVVSGVVWPVR